jgi:hypothetical protein
MSNIERQKENNDPKSALPTIMTDSLARESSGGTRTCVVSGGGFCSANEKESVDVKDVTWKGCVVHLLHPECFGEGVSKGRMPLNDLCKCIENSCSIPIHSFKHESGPIAQKWIYRKRINAITLGYWYQVIKINVACHRHY